MLHDLKSEEEVEYVELKPPAAVGEEEPEPEPPAPFEWTGE